MESDREQKTQVREAFRAQCREYDFQTRKLKTWHNTYTEDLVTLKRTYFAPRKT